MIGNSGLAGRACPCYRQTPRWREGPTRQPRRHSRRRRARHSVESDQEGEALCSSSSLDCDADQTQSAAGNHVPAPGEITHGVDWTGGIDGAHGVARRAWHELCIGTPRDRAMGAAGATAGNGADRLIRPIDVVIVDDHTIVREGTRELLEQAEDVRVVGEAATGQAAVAAITRLRPDVALLDLRLPDRTGIEVASR